MVEELAVLLHDRVDPSVWHGLVELTQVLDQHRAVLYKDRLVQLTMAAENHDPVTLVDEAIGIIFGQVEALLTQMRIRLDYSALSYQRLAEVLRVFLFQPNDLDDEALRALQQSEDSVEALSDVLSIYLNIESVELMEVVLEVSQDTVNVIELILMQNLSYQEESVEGVQETVQLINRHQQLVGENLTVGMEALQNGNAVHTDFDELVTQHQMHLQTLPDDQLGDHLISLALLARVPHISLKDEVMHFVESLRDDPVAVQRVYKRVIPRIDQLRSLIHEPS